MRTLTTTKDILAAPYADVVRQSGLVDGVKPEEVAAVVASLRARPRELAGGDVLCREGDAASCLWIVMKGRIGVVRDENPLTDRDAPYVIGEQALIQPGQVRSATLWAFGMTSVLEINRACIEALPVHVQAIVWRNIAGIVSEKLRQATMWRSWATNRDRGNQSILRGFLNSHQQGFIRAQGPITPDNLPNRLERGRFILCFTDVVGFSRLTLALGDDDIATVIQSCMKAQADAFEAAGGYVDKFMGDGMMAYFIVPEGSNKVVVAALCEGALDAARAAHAGVTAVCIADKPLGLRVGLHLGEALAGNFGSDKRMQVTLLGDDVNTAARLEQAKPDALVGGGEGTVLGDIRVSRAFFEALPDEMRTSLPYQAVMIAKQGPIEIFSGHPQTDAE